MVKDKEVINASEIGQYNYCSISWYLKRCGYVPQSPLLKKGVESHIELGDGIVLIDRYQQSSKRFAYLGYILFSVALIVLLIGVVQ